MEVQWAFLSFPCCSLAFSGEARAVSHATWPLSAWPELRALPDLTHIDTQVDPLSCVCVPLRGPSVPAVESQCLDSTLQPGYRVPLPGDNSRLSPSNLFSVAQPLQKLTVSLLGFITGLNVSPGGKKNQLWRLPLITRNEALNSSALTGASDQSVWTDQLSWHPVEMAFFHPPQSCKSARSFISNPLNSALNEDGKCCMWKLPRRLGETCQKRNFPVLSFQSVHSAISHEVIRMFWMGAPPPMKAVAWQSANTVLVTKQKQKNCQETAKEWAP